MAIVGVDVVDVGTCCQCKCLMTIPNALYHAARASEHIWFYCPYGHKQHYSPGESEADKLRRERDRLQQRLAEKDDTITRLDKRLSATRGVVTRIKNRVGHGVCPCCNRTFGNLANHMAHQHPTWSAEAAE